MGSRLVLLTYLDEGEPGGGAGGGRPSHPIAFPPSPWGPPGAGQGDRPPSPWGPPGAGGGAPGGGSGAPGTPVQLPVFPVDPGHPIVLPPDPGEPGEPGVPAHPIAGRKFELRYSPYYGWVLVPVKGDGEAEPKA